MLNEWTAWIPSISSLIAILVAVSTLKRRGREDVETLVGMKKDLKTVLTDISEIKASLKEQCKNFSVLEHRVTLVEGLAQRAHERIDEHVKHHHYGERGS